MFYDVAQPPLCDGKLLLSKSEPPTLAAFDYRCCKKAVSKQAGEAVHGDTWLRKKKKSFGMDIKLVRCNVLSMDPKCEQAAGVDEVGNTLSAKVSYLDVELHANGITAACFQGD